MPRPKSAPGARRDSRKRRGAHFTPHPVARFLAERLRNIAPRPRGERPLRVLDPAAGDGALLLALLEAWGPTTGPLEIYAFETDDQARRAAERRLSAAPPAPRLTLSARDFLEWHGAAPTSERFDVVIANPPWVRTQVLGAKTAGALARRFGLTGRVDLAWAFLLACIERVAPSGTLGFVLPNRLATTKAARSVRAAVLDQCEVLHFWDLGDTKLFDASVLPALLLLRKTSPRRDAPAVERPARMTSIYTAPSATAAPAGASVIDLLDRRGRFDVPGLGVVQVEQGALRVDASLEDRWRLSTPDGEAWLDQVHSAAWGAFGDIGPLRVGIKTTADAVFLRDDWDEIPEEERPELLRPLTTHHVARRYRARPLGAAWMVLYPHERRDGRTRAVELTRYPRSRRFLEGHRERLAARPYLSKAKRQWFEIWVPHDPDLWARPKLVWRDITERPCFWVDLDGTVVNGDGYWLVSESPSDDRLLWLACAVGNSTLAERYYDLRCNNRLYARRRRFMTQYVERFPLPDPAAPLSRRIIEAARHVHARADAEDTTALELEIDAMVREAFGL